jgi:glutathione S-transferase
MSLELFTFAGNTHALQSLVIARYNGVEIAVPPFEMGKDNKTKDFLAKSPMGKVPVLQTPEGCICEAAAIARYVARTRADTNMYGGSFFEAGLVDQWIEFAKNELDLPVGMWIYPILGFINSNASNTDKAKEDVKRALAVLDAHLLAHTYLVGEAITAADVVVFCSLLNAFKLVFDAAFLAAFPCVTRWFKTLKEQPEFLDVLGPTAMLTAEGGKGGKPAAAKEERASSGGDGGKKGKEKGGDKKGKPSPEEIEKLKAERAAEKAAKGAKGGDKKGGDKKEEKPKEAKKEEKKEEKAPDAAADAKAKAKLTAKIIKEGGKKGVEIEGASDMGGLDFFCTTMELPEGDLEQLELSMLAMNAEPDPEAEDRKGCSGHIGKMIYSAGVSQLALVAYVPDDEFNKSASKVDVTAWMDHVLGVIGGEVTKKATPTQSLIPDKKTGDILTGTKGKIKGKVIVAVAKADADKGKFPLKDKDAAMAAAFSYLRSKGAFPEDNDDDSDEMIFGDDDNLEDYF